MAKKSTAAPKPKNDAYSAMLFVTFVAIVAGCVLMFLDTEQYKEGTAPPASPALVLPKLGTTTVASSGPAAPAPAPAPAPTPEPPMPAPAPPPPP